MTKHFGQWALSGSRKGCEQVLAAVKHALAEGRYAGGMLPSYRQLDRELHVTVASVERATAQLERKGHVRREQGRGTLPLPQQKPAGPQKPYPIECINILMYTPPFVPSFVESDYLRGYTEALDCSPLENTEKPGTPQQRRILETHLIIRETTAPPRAIQSRIIFAGNLLGLS